MARARQTRDITFLWDRLLLLRRSSPESAPMDVFFVFSLALAILAGVLATGTA